MTSKHRVAIVGLGMALAPHLRSLEELDRRVAIAACHTPSPARRAAFAARHLWPLADDLDAILADASIGVVFILTPPNSHLDLVERCAAAGKHVLLKKPIDVTVERARRTVEAAERAGRKLAIMLHHAAASLPAGLAPPRFLARVPHQSGPSLRPARFLCRHRRYYAPISHPATHKEWPLVLPRPSPPPVTSRSTQQGFSGSHDLCTRMIWSPTPAARNLLAFSAASCIAFDL